MLILWRKTEVLDSININVHVFIAYQVRDLTKCFTWPLKGFHRPGTAEINDQMVERV
jgi:hypothetical protein